MRPKYHPQPRPFKLVILSVNGLFCTDMVILGDTLWDLKVRPRLRIIHVTAFIKNSMSLCSHTWKMPSFTMWFDTYLLEISLIDWHFCGANRSTQVQMGSLVETYFSSSKRKKFLHTPQICLIAGRPISCSSMINLANT